VRIEAATSSISLDRDRKIEAAAGQDQFVHRLLDCVEGIEKGGGGSEERGEGEGETTEVRKP